MDEFDPFNEDTLMLIDCGNFNFYRFFASKNWYCRSPKNAHLAKDDDVCWINLPDFMKHYKYQYLKQIENLQSTYGVLWDNIIFAMDCPRKNIWRNQHYPEYKAHRKSHSSEVPNAGPYPVFKYTCETIYPDLIRLYNCKVISINTAEADDIIAHVQMHVRKLYKTRQIIIVSGDHDFFQLSDPYTKIVDPRTKKVINDNVNAEFELFSKILQGDKSDNIPNCFPKCGPVTAKKCLTVPGFLTEQVNKHSGALEHFKLNQLIIDFNKVPDHIKKEIVEAFLGFKLKVVENCTTKYRFVIKL